MSRNDDIIRFKPSIEEMKNNSIGKSAIKVKKSKLNIPRTLLTLIVTGVIGTALYGVGKSVYDRHTESKIIDAATDEIEEIVNYSKKPINYEGSFYFDYQSASKKLKDKIESGEMDPDVVAWKASELLNADYLKDDRDKFFENLYGVNADTYARERGYNGVDDPDFASEMKARVLRNYEVENYKKEETDDYVVETTRVDNPEEQQSDELNTMFVDDNTNANVNDNAKGMGGR